MLIYRIMLSEIIELLSISVENGNLTNLKYNVG